MSRPSTRAFATVLLLAGLLAGCAGGASPARKSAAGWPKLTAEERAQLAAARAEALERKLRGEAVVWRASATGRGGVVVPLKTVRMADGRYCRDYRETVSVGGKEQARIGRACRTADGHWREALRRA